MDSRVKKMSVTALSVLLVIINFASQSEAQNSSDPCSGVQCQQGDCVVDSGVFMLGYQCKCHTGWTKVIDFPFFGCGIPDCQLSFTCDNSSASAPSLAPTTTPAPSNVPLDFCSLPNLCGPNGHCVSNQSQGLLPTVSYKCDCNPGNENLFNMSTGLCLPICNLQGNCQNLGLPLTPPAPGTPSPPGTPPSPSGGKRYKSFARWFTSVTLMLAVMWF